MKREVELSSRGWTDRLAGELFSADVSLDAVFVTVFRMLLWTRSL